jgi:haloalkane dehalogenase
VSHEPRPWLDRQEYPFTSRWLSLPEGAMHYVDEGTGPPILLVHGTPTWSFLYRHLIRALRTRYRCVAPDLPGFGLSAKPAEASYHPRDQATRLARLVEALGLVDLTLVVHDFGGPIGLSYALDRPDNVRGLVLFNTWMWSLAADRRVARVGRLLGGRLGRVLHERFGFSVNVIWRRAIGDRTRYTRAIHRHYAGPLATPADRHATWVYARELLGAGDWYQSLWRRRERLASIPALLVWGAADPAFGRFLGRWRQALPHAEIVEMAGVGHAPPEERGPESAAAVARFLERTAMVPSKEHTP